MEMDLDIDTVLDQLEKTLNQSNEEGNETKEEIVLPLAKTSIDDINVLDLDPYANHENELNATDEETLERFKLDLQELYSSSTIVPSATATGTEETLSDQVLDDEQSNTVTLPTAVEHLEYEVRQEILQHTFDNPSSSPLLIEETTGSPERNDEETPHSRRASDVEQISTVDEPENSLTGHVLHSVDSIVNAKDLADVENFVSSSSTTLISEPVPSPSSEPMFTAADDELMITSTDEPIENSSVSVPSPMISSTATAQDFDLVKNMLSEIFDKPDEENLDESMRRQEDSSDLIPIEQQEETSTTTNNDGDFRFLDEMLTSIDGTDREIPPINQTEIDRVDSILQDIVNTQQSEPMRTENLIDIPDEMPVETNETGPSDATASASSLVESMPIDEELVRVEQEWARLTDEEKQLGSIAPEWVSDDQAPLCMKCSAKFSITRRRHHCRACGKVFCAACCSQRVKLMHFDNREDRACNDCVRIINRVDYLWTYMRNNQKPRSSALRKATGVSASATATGTGTNPNGRSGSEHKKSVTFGDGVKPGAEIPDVTQAKKNIKDPLKSRTNSTEIDQISLFKPEILTAEEFEDRLHQLKDPNQAPIEYSIHKNLFVSCKIVDHVDQPFNHQGSSSWIFTTRGLAGVSQDELVYIFDEQDITEPQTLIADLLTHIHQIYLDATKGSFVRHLCLSFASASPSKFLSTDHAGGFLYVCDPFATHELFPEPPYLFGILLHREEIPTAQCFPIRLLLRLGYEYQSYPWPLFSILHRSAMFNDTQHTIMSLLCDFRSFNYTIPTIRGLTISIGHQGSVSIRIPRNRHDEIVKSLEQSSPHALSFGVVNVNRQAHSKHLVAVQDPTTQQYETRLFTSPSSTSEQIMIGGSFVVINASLRSRDSPSSSPLDSPSSGSFSSNNNLNAKVNTIEDGIMLQLDGDTFKMLKQSFRERKDYAILAKAKPIHIEENKDQSNGTVIKRSSTEQLVEFLWIEEDNDVNTGVRSPIDHFPMDGIRNSHIHYAGQRSPAIRLRWTNLFFIEYRSNNAESFDPTRLAESLAKGFTQALTPYGDMLGEAKCRKLGLRVTIDRENGSYLAGSNGEQLAPFFLSQLDDQMIPIVMKASDSLPSTAGSIVLELVFYLLD